MPRGTRGQSRPISAELDEALSSQFKLITSSERLRENSELGCGELRKIDNFLCLLRNSYVSCTCYQSLIGVLRLPEKVNSVDVCSKVYSHSRVVALGHVPVQSGEHHQVQRCRELQTYSLSVVKVR